MEGVQVSEAIQAKIRELDKGHDALKTAADNKADALSSYSKALAVATLKIKNGKIKTFEGEEIGKLTANALDRIVKGQCWEQELAKDLAECEYKRVVKKLDVVMAQLNGFQSINRHLSSM